MRSSGNRPEVSVVVASFSGAEILADCLDGLARQVPETPRFEVVVVSTLGTGTTESLERRFASLEMRFVSAPVGTDVFALRARGVEQCRGRRIVLTEDHTVATRRWLVAFEEADPRAEQIAGGPIEPHGEARGSELGLLLCEYGFYLPPWRLGPTAALSGLNLAYPRQLLEDCLVAWQGGLRENEVNDILRARGYYLHGVPEAVVTSRLRMIGNEARAHLYSGGKHFGRYRKASLGPPLRWLLPLAGPAVPMVLTARLIRRVVRRGSPWVRRLPAALPSILGLIAAWSAGEIQGYWMPTTPLEPDGPPQGVVQ